MIPDKIYMPNELLSEEWQRHIEGEDTCYIRKDLLLEWAKERYQQTISNVGCYTGHSVWEEVIEHIEAL